MSFRSYRNISIGLPSKLSLGKSRVRRHCLVVFLVCLGPLSCCRTHYQLSVKPLTDDRIFWSRIWWQDWESMFPWIIGRPDPEAEKQPQVLKFPPSCFTVEIRFYAGQAVLAFLQTWQFWLWPGHYIFDSSVQRIVFQKSSDSFKCSLAKFKRANLFVVESRGFLLAIVQ